MIGLPSDKNDFLAAHVDLMLRSLRQWTGRDLVAPEMEPALKARAIFYAPYVVLSHDHRADPLLTYANQAGLSLFELTWEELLVMPSRRTAEPMHRSARESLLATVTRQGFIDNYRGIRISKGGRRFQIEQATVWNLVNPGGALCGQAATFGQWHFLD